MPTRILVVGAGAIGAFFGSRLATVSNVLVSALCRSNYKAVKTHGFKITSPNFGDWVFRPEHVFATSEEARKSKLTWDFLLVATKALPDVRDDSVLLEGLVDNNTSIVLIQNGLGIEKPYHARFPKTTILSAVANASVSQPAPGDIRHNRWTKLTLGPYLPHLDTGNGKESDTTCTAQATQFVDLLTQGGIPDAEALDHANLQFARWHKVAINGAFNPSAVLSGGAGNQEFALDAELSEFAKGVMREVLETAVKVLGRPLPGGLATPEMVMASVRKNTSGSRPSMWHDWEQGRKMELEVILGNPIGIARERGLEMPRLQTMYALLRTKEGKRERAREGGKL